MAGLESSATAVWHGNLTEGSGEVTSGTGVITAPVTWASRTEEPAGKTSPEELIAAAHASCYAMAFSNTLSQGGNEPQELTVTSTVTFAPKDGGGFEVKSSALKVVGKVPGMSSDEFATAAIEGEKGCPVSNALRNNVKITVEASLA